MSLYDRPDPRRLDLRASLRTLDDDWLVRVNRQRAGITVRALVDVSASMSFGSQRPKLHVVADFIESLGLSAFRVGDAVGMMAFDAAERSDLFVPPRVSRGMGSIMGAVLRGLGAVQSTCAPEALPDADRAPVSGFTRARSETASGSDGLEDAASHLAGQQGLIFLVSDFHWPLERLDNVLDLFAHAGVVPIIVWDRAETEPPARNALASLRDAESGTRRTLWVRPRLREEWRRAVAQRRAEIDSLFAAHAIRPFYVQEAFEADAMSRYFFETDT